MSELTSDRRALLDLLLKEEGFSKPSQTKIPRRPDDESVSLSFAQERLWYLEQLDPGTSVYNFPLAFRLEGPVDAESLDRAFKEVINRHEMLRTTFSTVEGKPVQVIADKVRVSLPLLDFTSLSETELETDVKHQVSENAQTPFDLSKGPLVRAKLLRVKEASHVLLMCVHHIIADMLSMDIFFKELVTLYEAFSRGNSSPLDELPIQYADFAHWQRKWLQGEELETQLSYWQSQLSDNPPALELPTDRPRPAIQTFPGACHSFAISSELAAGLRKFSQQEAGTLFMAFLLLLKALLYRYTGQEDIVIGSPIANRNRPEVEGLIGFFLNTLVLRTDLSGNPTFRELFSRVKEVALGAYAHQDIPFEKLVEELKPERDLSRSPWFQIMLILHNESSEVQEFAGLKFGSPLPQTNRSAKFDLTLYIEPAKDGLTGTFEYNTDLFDATTIERMAGHFQRLLEGVVENPDLHLSELSILSKEERQHLLVDCNATALDYPGDKCLHHLFEAQVDQTPDSTAVIFEDKQLTYKELNTRANQLAHHLKQLGVGPDTLVGICSERSLEMVVGLLGILKAGGAYVPLDPAFPQDRLAYMVEDAQPLVLLTQQSLFSELFNETSARVLCLDSDWPEIAKQSAWNPKNETTPTNLAYVIYTSGSTGKPKGVTIQHQTLVNFLTSMSEEPGLKSEDRLLAVTTLSFDIAGLELYLPLITGARVILASRETASDARRLGETIAETGATVMQATPATWRMLLDSGWQGHDKLKILCGGEALPRELANRLMECGSSLWNMYGPTETTIWSAVHGLQSKEGMVPVGAPIANTQLYMLDRNYHPVPIGVYGELYIGGEGLARGYLNRPDLTAERFVPDSFSENPGVRLYRTGDKARFLADGSIEFSGRLDFQVKIRGFRIELGEIETVCVDHPAVKQAIVMAREITNGDMRLVAYIRFDSHDEPTVSELRRFLKSKLPDYMVPSMFVSMDSFPLTPNGKVDRKKLLIPAGMKTDTGHSFEPPGTDMEKLIAEVWQQVLGTNSFCVHDNFFDLGGHSLLSMKVLYHLEKRLGLRINPREIIFKNLRHLAAFCEEQLNSKGNPSSNTITKKLLRRFSDSVA